MALGPLKAPNPNPPVAPEDLPYELELYASPKLDGNRGLCIAGELRSSSMKIPRNARLVRFFNRMITFCRRHQMVLDYEIFDPTGEHHAQISGLINSDGGHIPKSVHAYVFDAMPLKDFEAQCLDLPYRKRITIAEDAVDQIQSERVVLLEQTPVKGPKAVEKLFKRAVFQGHEGLMVRAGTIDKSNPRRPRGGWYKHGRATLNQGIIYKMKVFETVDGQITEVVQGSKMREGVERERDPATGNLKPVTGKGNKVPDNIVGSFVVRDAQGRESRVGFGPGFTLGDRRALWNNRKSLLGLHVEFKHMDHGAKTDGGFRIGKFVRFRPDLD